MVKKVQPEETTRQVKSKGINKDNSPKDTNGNFGKAKAASTRLQQGACSLHKKELQLMRKDLDKLRKEMEEKLSNLEWREIYPCSEVLLQALGEDFTKSKKIYPPSAPKAKLLTTENLPGHAAFKEV